MSNSAFEKSFEKAVVASGHDALTASQKKRVTADWSKIAKEPITVERIGGAYYAYGSELACLRLYYKFRYVKDDAARVLFSKNLNTWTFALETNS